MNAGERSLGGEAVYSSSRGSLGVLTEGHTGELPAGIGSVTWDILSQ